MLTGLDYGGRKSPWRETGVKRQRGAVTSVRGQPLSSGFAVGSMLHLHVTNSKELIQKVLNHLNITFLITN